MALPKTETTPDSAIPLSSPPAANGRKRTPTLLPTGFRADRELQRQWHITGVLPLAKPSPQKDLHKEWVSKGLLPADDSEEAIRKSNEEVNRVILVEPSQTQ